MGRRSAGIVFSFKRDRLKPDEASRQRVPGAAVRATIRSDETGEEVELRVARRIYKAHYEASWALIIGINEYRHASKLEHAKEDAAAVASVLLQRFEFSSANVTSLFNEDATLQEIQRAMHRLARDANDDDRVIVFYAGHGHTVPAHGREAGFLVPVDGRASDTATLLPWDDLVNTSRIIRAKHLLFIMDACYGGLIATRALAPGSKRLLRDMLGRYSRQYLTAGKGDEAVADSGGPRPGHSVFTGHLLDALDGSVATSDGLISANAVMAYVYDRVAKDPHSFQAPHYGFLAGDGDFFFAAPAIKVDEQQTHPEDDVLVEVPPDLMPQVSEHEETAMPTNLLEKVKELLSDHSYRIRLHDLVMRELRTVQQKLGDEKFDVQRGTVSKEEFSERLLGYEAAMAELLPVAALLGQWAEPRQQSIVRQLVNIIGAKLEQESGNRLWLALRSYPMLLTMYVAGISALDGDNYESLKTLLSTPVRRGPQHEAVSVVQATTQTMAEGRTADVFKWLPGHERHYTPQSEYLFKRVQPIVEDMLFLGARYEGLFDRFELFYALTYADYEDGYWGHPGRFAWKYRARARTGPNDPFSVLVGEAKREGQKWPPLCVGLFRGSTERFLEVAERFRAGLLDKLPWH